MHMIDENDVNNIALANCLQCFVNFLGLLKSFSAICPFKN